MSQKLKIVTIGGGSSYTPELLEGFIKRYHELPVTELWLVDVEEGQEKLDIIHALCQRMVEKAGVPMKVYKTLDRRAALEGAHFVTTQLRVGQLKAREKMNAFRSATATSVRRLTAPAVCLKVCVPFR